MNKLMFLCAVVAMTAVSQAASLKWSYSSAQNDATYNDTTWYLIAAEALPTAADFKAAKDFTTWLDAQDYTEQSKKTSYNAGTKKYSNSFTATADSITKEGTYYLVLVKSDASEVQLSQLIAGSSQVFGEKDTTITTSITPSGTWMAVGSVPEPTSGLLLLVGIAGLALRRRRA